MRDSYLNLNWYLAEPLTTRFVRNPNKEEFEQGKFLIHTGGKKPDFDASRFVPAEVKAGKEEEEEV